MKWILRKNIRHTVFFNYTFSFVVLLIIPVILITVFSYGYFIYFFRADIVHNNQYMLNNLKTVMNNKIIKFKSISYYIQQNDMLTSYAINRDILGKIDAINELNKYKNYDDIISELVLHIHDDEHLYTSSSIYSIESFKNKIYKYENWGYDDFYRSINSFGDPILRNVEPVLVKNNKEPDYYITYIIPGPKSKTNISMATIFLIQENKLRKLFSEMSGKYNANILIFDKDKNILFSYKDIEKNNYADLKKKIMDVRNDNGYIELDGKKYLYTYINSTYTNWTYLTLISDEEAMGYVFDIRRNCLYGILLALSIGTIVICYLIKINYKPIKQLKEFSEELCGKSITENDELKAIKAAMIGLYGSGNELRKRVINDLPAVREFLLSMLLQGRIDDIAKFNTAAKETGMIISNPFYAVAVFSSRDCKHLKDNIKDLFYEFIQSIVNGGIECYGKEGIDNQTVIFVIAMKEDNWNQLEEQLCQFQKTMYTQLGVTITIGIGKKYKSSDQIGRSYMEALSALDYRFIVGENKVIFFENVFIVQKGKLIDYPDEELSRFQFSLKQGNIRDIEEILMSIVKFITLQNVPLLTARCICYDIINTIIKTLHNFSVLSKLLEKDYFNIEKLNSFNTVDEMVDVISKICFSICEFISYSKESHNFDLKDNLILYISENCDDPDLSVNKMAEKFNMTQSYLSRFFKDQTGYTLTAFIALQRVKKAKYLLRSTSKPFKDIIIQIGYYNETSFLRNFKKIEGVTPGEFRRLNINSGGM